MLPQGTLPVNLDYFTSLQKRIDGIGSCEQLKELTEEAYATITASMDGINAQIALLEPILALLTAPAADPDKIVTWITTFITSFLTPYVRPYTIYASQLTELTTKMAEIEAAISSAALKFPSCDVPIPSLPPPAA